jgi:hypothetical protein
MPSSMGPLWRCGVCRLLFIVYLLLVDPSAVYAQGNATSGSDPLATVAQFARDFSRLKQSLADLPRKIEETSEVVSRDTDSATARQEVDALREIVAGLLSSLADNGSLAKLVPSRCVLEFVWRGLRLDEDIGSGGEVNRLVSELLGEGLPSIDFAHGDLTSSE